VKGGLILDAGLGYLKAAYDALISHESLDVNGRFVVSAKTRCAQGNDAPVGKPV
jgi:hypothetical protein